MKNKGNLLPPDKDLELCKANCIECGKKCPLKSTCIRNNTEPLVLQRWFMHPPCDKKTGKCEYYQDIETMNLPNCGGHNK